MLEVNALSVSYGELDILKDVSFTVDTGEWLMIAGPNGPRKSTIINALTARAPYKGNIVGRLDNAQKSPASLLKA